MIIHTCIIKLQRRFAVLLVKFHTVQLNIKTLNNVINQKLTLFSQVNEVN